MAKNESENESLENAVEAAILPIKEKNYKQELLNRNIEKILELAIAFQGKDLLYEKDGENAIFFCFVGNLGRYFVYISYMLR